MSLNVYRLKLTSARPQGVPGEPPPGIWDGRKVCARDETHAVEVANELFPGWTVLTVEADGVLGSSGRPEKGTG